MRKYAIAALLCSAAIPANAQLYTDAFAGVAVFDRTTTVSGIKAIDTGGDALLAGARVGYGHRWPSGLYLSGEAELAAGAGRSRFVVNGQVDSYALRGIAGAFTRIGFATRDSNALLYARLGGQAMLTNRGTQYVPAVGIGAQIPISQHWYVRIDMTYAWNDVETYQGTAGIGVWW